MQIGGCVVMGLGYALTEKVNFKGGETRYRNFDIYDIPRFSWLPKVETVLIENPETPRQGGREPPIICMGEAIANAVFDATGVRIIELPMTPDQILTGLQSTH